MKPTAQAAAVSRTFLAELIQDLVRVFMRQLTHLEWLEACMHSLESYIITQISCNFSNKDTVYYHSRHYA